MYTDGVRASPGEVPIEIEVEVDQILIIQGAMRCDKKIGGEGLWLGKGRMSGHLTRNLWPEQIVQAERTGRSACL